MRAAALFAGLCFLAVAAAAAGSSEQAQRPSLVVTETKPFVVRGAGFEPGERVQVLLALDGTQRFQRTAASSSGVFVVRFPVSFGTCSRFTIRAFGSKGSSARVPLRRTHIGCVSPVSGGAAA